MTQWEIAREGELGRVEHTGIADLLGAAYPDFPVGCSWSGSRPEMRLIGWEDGRVIAHAGVLRRFVRATEAGAQLEVLVGAVGLVAVHPDHRGRGVGRALGERLAAVLGSLSVPFGLLMSGEDTVGYYRALGWSQLPEVDVRYLDDYRVIDTRCATAMLLPVRVPLRAWPSAESLDWAGSLV